MRTPIRFHRVGEPYWNDKPVAIIGGGPSLLGFDFDRLRGRFHVVAVNASIFTVPWADAGFSLDRIAMRNWWDRLCQATMPLYLAVPLPYLKDLSQPPADHMRFMWRIQRNTFARYHGQIASGGSSGFGALNLAWLKRAKKVLLLGFDYGATNGAWHHNESEYNFHFRQKPDDWLTRAGNFNLVAPLMRRDGVEVINASPQSAITAFPRMTIDEALA